MSPQAFLKQLKESTAVAHQALEDGDLSRRLMMPDVTLSDYTAYLQRMQPVIAFADAQLLPFLEPVVPQAAERKKLSWLNADLNDLQAPAAEQPTYHPFNPKDTAHALGFFYVIEGSILGGRVILKQLQKRLPITAEEGGRFFAGYGEATSAHWKSFMDVFGEYITAHGAEEQAIAGANEAFTSIKQHFNN